MNAIGMIRKSVSAFVAGLVLWNCSGEAEMRYVAVQTEDSDMWSILDVQTGEVICRDEFKNEPFLVMNDLFCVENSDGFYEYYDVKDVKKPVGNDVYLQAGTFSGDVAFAVKEGEPISIIDRSCNVVKQLPKDVKETIAFAEGMAAYTDGSGKWGFLNEKGEVVIKAKYDTAYNFSDGVAVVSEEKGGKTRYSVIDKSGDALYSFASDKYDDFSGFYTEGLMAVGKDGKVSFVNKEGEKVFSNSAMEYEYAIFLYQVHDGKVIYQNDDLYGLIDTDGNILIRAKYEDMTRLAEDRYSAKKNGKWGLVDASGEEILPFDYEQLGGFSSGNYLAWNSVDEAVLIGEDGKELSKEQFENFGLKSWNRFTSNFYDADGVAAELAAMMKPAECAGFSGSSTAADVAQAIGLADASDYAYSSETSESRELKCGETATVKYVFSGSMTEPVTEVEDYGWGYYYERTVGYRFSTSSRLSAVGFLVSTDGYKGASDRLAKAIRKQLLAAGFNEDSQGMFQSGKGTAVEVSAEDTEVKISYYFDSQMVVPVVSSDVSADSVASDTWF